MRTQLVTALAAALFSLAALVAPLTASSPWIASIDAIVVVVDNGTPELSRGDRIRYEFSVTDRVAHPGVETDCYDVDGTWIYVSFASYFPHSTEALGIVTLSNSLWPVGTAINCTAHLRDVDPNSRHDRELATLDFTVPG